MSSSFSEVILCDVSGKWSDPEHTKFIIDFSHPDASRQLTIFTLLEYFDIQVELPENRLCPPVPQRLNYLLWIQDLLTLSDNQHLVSGFDIGVGASCIFPLLGVKHLGWKFAGSEIDSESLEYASRNVSKNCLEERITLQVGSSDYLLPPEGDFTFCMCNPPFFDGEQDEMKDVSHPNPNPSRSKVKATFTELCCTGGEVEFVKKLCHESIEAKDRFRWFTSMIGKKSSLKTLQALMFANGAKVVRVQEFIQGRLSRWGIAWTFHQDIVDAIRRNPTPPPTTTTTIT
eukprot:TRINITY_DN44713_c0_g1_i1.p1 TRINITY_DN44713_c0_g1~~TRINITY_DN44713_c0_g1_i1.p1  ORF type:complete len:287 (-),score=52.25 TRINITY_DN44713_c0_g1_i1:25-885(-)